MQQNSPQMVRVDPSLLDRVDRWRRSMPAVPSRTEAIRYLLRSRLDEIEGKDPK